jgi:hypothetical protein
MNEEWDERVVMIYSFLLVFSNGHLMNKKTSVVRRSLALHDKQLENLQKQAAREGMNVSELMRKAVDKYLAIEGYKEDIDFLTGIIRQEVRAETSKQGNRIAAMLFKVGSITSSNYFLQVRMLADMINPSLQEDFSAINSVARKLGIDYMKQNGAAVVEFLEDDEAVEAAADKIKYGISATEF